MNFQKLQLKWKIPKHFARPKQRCALRKLFSLPHPTSHQITPYYLNFLKELCRQLLSNCFKNAVLRRQEMAQCKYFFWHQTETCLLENLESQKGFWLRCGSILFSMSSELKFIKWMRFFERNCIVKCLIFFVSFCWFRDFLLENLKLKKSYDDFHQNVWSNIKALYARNNIFKKRIPNMIFWS